MSESKVEQVACRAILKKFGVKSIKLTPMKSTGFPDRIFWLPGGKPLLIEFKSSVGFLSLKQEYIIGQLKALGYRVVVCRTVKEALMAVEDLIFRLKDVRVANQDKFSKKRR
jgi:intracellular sulfur oxidation DsrE/DsrF family protein